MKIEQLPLSFISENVDLTWTDVEYAKDKKWLAWRDFSEIAIDRLQSGAQVDPLETELAGIGKQNAGDAGELVTILASKESTTDAEASRRKWLLLALLWIYQNQDSFVDPLAEAEEAVSDVGDLDDAVHIFRYMPTTGEYDSSAHSYDENIHRLNENWKTYLFKNATKYLRPHALDKRLE